MALSNHERVGKGLELLKRGLAPYIEREFASHFQGNHEAELARYLGEDRINSGRPVDQWDAAVLLKMMWDAWNEVFGRTLGRVNRSLVSELRDARNKWAHQENFSGDDAYRALDSACRLLTAISAPESVEVERMKMELLRVRFDEQARTEKRKTAAVAIESAASSGLKPWREVVSPHRDVASGRYQQAEFAADLWQVHIGEGTDEYREPIEFFRRTFITESLKQLLINAVERLAGTGGDPVVQLQTNFGGGKTHSMLATYHLFSGAVPQELPGIEAILEAAGTTKVDKVRRVVLVGNKISPGSPSVKADGTVVHTLWGELAWQLGGREAYDIVRNDDERATNPGDVMRELFNKYGPCLILIDEWVAYARQLHDKSDLPAGSFETQFTFAQALTESAKLAKQCLLVISLPASDTSGSPHAGADNAEVGGERGREALDRLQNVTTRVESSWRPASAEESFEIVRRRLFEPMVEKEQFVGRDTVARAFFDLYRTQKQEFPPECGANDYEKRLKEAYPIHPEVFDRLYTDWSTLERFQRTRGVLRLMAAVIHSLWEKGDKNPLILPSNIPIDDPRVQSELTRYLSDNWAPVIEKDVDGPNSLPMAIDRDVPNLGKFSACRRVARTIFLGSAPVANAANRGLEDRRVKLGCVMPGESPAVFGDGLRRLASAATYLYQDGSRYWYSTQATVTKMAEDIAEQLKREPDKVSQEIARRVRDNLKQAGDFSRIHALPQSGQDVPDEFDARLVVIDIDHPYSKDADDAATVFAKKILESRGNAPRLYRNTLVFMAVDKTRLQDLDEAARRFLAWESIVSDKETLDLSPHQVKQAETQRNAADSTVNARIPEAYQWLLVPGQTSPQAPIEWQSIRLSGQDALAVRASKKLKNDELLVTAYASTLLRIELDRVPLWRGDHVTIRQLVEDYARYLYLPRLVDPKVLLNAIDSGASLLTWQQDSFAYADSYDEDAGRYRGLVCSRGIAGLSDNSTTLLVHPKVAKEQIDRETVVNPPTGGDQPETPTGGLQPGIGGGAEPPAGPVEQPKPKRFFGTVELDPTRVGRDASKIADEVIAHLTSIVGSKVKVTLEIEAEAPAGVPDDKVRTVTENSRTLKFTSQGFEKE